MESFMKIERYVPHSSYCALITESHYRMFKVLRNQVNIYALPVTHSEYIFFRAVLTSAMLLHMNTDIVSNQAP